MNLDLTALIHKNNKGNITSLQKLHDQDNITYGTLREGETYRYMTMSSDELILKLSRFIYRNAYLLVNSRQEGIEKVLNSNYAFIQVLIGTRVERFSHFLIKTDPLN